MTEALFSRFARISAAVAILAPLAAQAQSEGASSSPQVAPAPVPAPIEAAAAAAETPASQEKPFYAVGAEGITLPSRVMRARLPMQTAWGKTGYDNDGKKKDLGLDLSVNAMAFVLEYGITDTVSLQLVAPYVLSNKVGMDAKKFRQSKDYKDNYNKFIGGIAKVLAATAGSPCTKEADCLDLIVNKNLALPVPMTLPTGEVLSVPNQPIKDAVDSLIVNYAAPKEGKTGITDIEIGALWNPISAREPLYDLPLFFSAGLGVRLPTGSFKDVPSGYRATGRGTFDLGLRANVDWRVVDWFWINYQNQAEYMLSPGKKSKTSMLDNTQLNKADPTTNAARAVGSDGKSNSQKFERKGLRNVGYIKAAVGLGVIDQTLKALSMNSQLKYDFGSTEYLDGTKTGDPSSSYGVLVGGSVDGLAYAVPLQLDVDYTFPVGGKNQSLAASVFSMAIKGYYKF